MSVKKYVFVVGESLTNIKTGDQSMYVRHYRSNVVRVATPDIFDKAIERLKKDFDRSPIAVKGSVSDYIEDNQTTLLNLDNVISDTILKTMAVMDEDKDQVKKLKRLMAKKIKMDLDIKETNILIGSIFNNLKDREINEVFEDCKDEDNKKLVDDEIVDDEDI